MDISTRFHYRGGKFGRAEKSYENDFYKYIDYLTAAAEGFLHKITEFTIKKNGKVDDDRINKCVDNMLSKHKNYRDEDEKKFYTSFLYCALALYSLNFECYGSDFGDHLFRFSGVQKNFRDLVSYSMLEYHEDEKRYVLDQFGDYSQGFSNLYELITGSHIDFGNSGNICLPTGKEYDEIMEDIYSEGFEDSSYETMEDLYYYELEEEEFSLYEESDDEDDTCEGREITGKGSMDKNEDKRAHKIDIKIEKNRISAERIKTVYPGYRHFVKNLDQFKALFSTYASTGFYDTVKEMVSKFLIEGGYSLYNNEDALIETFILLKKTKRTLHKAFCSTYTLPAEPQV